MVKNYVSNKDETVRMFKSDFFEFFSKVHPAVPAIVYLPVIAYFFYKSGEYNIQALNIFLYTIFGLVVWTATEYILHRFIFHFEPRGPITEKLHFIFHGVHHDYPSDSRRLVMPPAVSIPLALFFYYLFRWILGDVMIYPFFAAFLIGYLIYDNTHYAIHHLRSNNKLFLYIKKHHMRHHYKDAAKGFGVSQPLWDHVFGTTFPQDKNYDMD